MKRKALYALTALAIGGYFATAQAQSFDDRWYFSAGIYGNHNDDSRLTKTNSVVGALGIGKYLTDNISVEGFFDYTTRHFNRGPDGSKADPFPGALRSAVFGIDGRYFFGAPDAWRPYLLVGVGADRTQATGLAPTNNSTKWGPMVEAGFGVSKAMTENVGFRAEAKYRYNEDKDSQRIMGVDRPEKNFGDWMVGVGVTVALGAAPQPPMEEPVAPPPPPPPPPVEEPAPHNVVIDLRGVNFKFDRPKIGEHNIEPTLQVPTSDSLAILDQAVDVLNRYPEIRVELDGHTDSIGTDAYNQKLSERRAQIVNDYLLSHGIDASRISAVRGFGKTQPIDTNETKEGRARNRRTELKVDNPSGM